MNKIGDPFSPTFCLRVNSAKPLSTQKIMLRVSKIGQNARLIEKNQGWRRATFSGGQWRDALSFSHVQGIYVTTQTKRANVSHTHMQASLIVQGAVHSGKMVSQVHALANSGCCMVIRLGN